MCVSVCAFARHYRNTMLYHLVLQDTAGSERYQAMSRIYYRGAKAAVVCYDLTDKLSYEKAQFWVQELLKCGEEVSLTCFFA